MSVDEKIMQEILTAKKRTAKKRQKLRGWKPVIENSDVENQITNSDGTQYNGFNHMIP